MSKKLFGTPARQDYSPQVKSKLKIQQNASSLLFDSSPSIKKNDWNAGSPHSYMSEQEDVEHGDDNEETENYDESSLYNSVRKEPAFYTNPAQDESELRCEDCGGLLMDCPHGD